MSDIEGASHPSVASEAIMVVDLVESTAAANLFGWYAVGRGLMRDLRSMIGRLASEKGIRCLKNTGDGYLLTFSNPTSAEMAVLSAVETSFTLMDLIELRNMDLPEERGINLRFAIHFGEVDVVENDREGPHVSYAFRLENISRASLASALNPISPDDLPLRNYVLCSEEVAGIVMRRSQDWNTTMIGLFKLKGFPGWREVFRILPRSEVHIEERKSSPA
jgi:class 3 adenylate cyclase